MAKQEVPTPAGEAAAIWQAAREARQRGEAWFACCFTVGRASYSQTLVQGARGDASYTTPAPLITGVENAGWRLFTVDHVFVQGAQGLGAKGVMTNGVVQGHYLFRAT